MRCKNSLVSLCEARVLSGTESEPWGMLSADVIRQTDAAVPALPPRITGELGASVEVARHWFVSELWGICEAFPPGMVKEAGGDD